MVDVGLDHGGVDPHSPTRHQAIVLRDRHHALVNLAHHLGSQRHAPATHRLGVRGLGPAHAREVAIHQVGADLALKHGVAPVPDVLEDQQAQHNLRRHAQPAAAAALRMAPGQRLVHRRDDALVAQHPVGMLHPSFAKVAHLLGNQTVAEAELRSAHLNHAAFPRVCASAQAAEAPD